MSTGIKEKSHFRTFTPREFHELKSRVGRSFVVVKSRDKGKHCSFLAIAQFFFQEFFHVCISLSRHQLGVMVSTPHLRACNLVFAAQVVVHTTSWMQEAARRHYNNNLINSRNGVSYRMSYLSCDSTTSFYLRMGRCDSWSVILDCRRTMIFEVHHHGRRQTQSHPKNTGLMTSKVWKCDFFFMPVDYRNPRSPVLHGVLSPPPQFYVHLLLTPFNSLRTLTCKISIESTPSEDSIDILHGMAIPKCRSSREGWNQLLAGCSDTLRRNATKVYDSWIFFRAISTTRFFERSFAVVVVNTIMALPSWLFTIPTNPLWRSLGLKRVEVGARARNMQSAVRRWHLILSSASASFKF